MKLLQQQAPLLIGRFSHTIFPNTEEMLQEIEYQEALEIIAKSKKIDRYQSYMDFLFCEIYLEYQNWCFKFYNDEGPDLQNCLNSKQIAQFDHNLCLALKVAKNILDQKREKSWTSFRCEFLQKSLAI